MAIDSQHDKLNKRLGIKGEKKACRYLKRKGYKIIERRYVNPFGEVDIIAERKDVLAFIEVKTRLSDLFGTPSEAVNRSRMKKYVLAAKHYFIGKQMDKVVRFDIIEVYKGSVNHIENAFTEQDC